MIGIIRYLNGYVRIRVSGYSPERFMNLCTNRGIILWGMNGFDGYYEMYIGLSDFFKIKDIVRKTKTKAVVLERFGLPFFMHDLLRRKVFAAGTFLCILFLILMSRFVWSMEFHGNEMITDDELYDFLEANGVTYAMPKSALKLKELEFSVRETFPVITWASAELEGSKLILELKENDLPTEDERARELSDWEEGADLCATSSGIVYSILTRAGIPQVKAGDTVNKGDVLISGLVPVTNDDGTVREWLKVAADGDVIIESDEPVEIVQKLQYTYKNYTGRIKNYSFLSVAGYTLRLPPKTAGFIKYDEVAQEKRLQLFGQIDLPVFYGEIQCREYLPVEAVYDEESAKKLLEKSFLKIIGGLEQKGVHIIQKNVKRVRKADSLAVKGSLTVHKEAAVRKTIAAVQEESVQATGE